MAYTGGVGPSKPSISYDISAAVLCAAVVKYCNSQIRRSNVLRVVSAVRGKKQKKWHFKRLFNNYKYLTPRTMLRIIHY